jgi:type I restriction enzyme S subunit
MKRVALSDVAEVNPRLDRTLLASPDVRVSFVPMASVSEDGSLVNPEERRVSDVLKGYTAFRRGDVLVAKITPCMENGKAALVDELPHEFGFGSTEFHVLRPGSLVDPRYLFYAVWNPKFRSTAESQMTGSAGQKRVPSDFFERYRLPLPPLPEQRRIAAILDEADLLRRKRREALGLLDELLRSAFLEMFGDPVTNPRGWPRLSLRTVIANIEPGWSASGTDRPAAPGEWGVLKVSAVSTGLFLPDENKRVESPEFAKPPIVPRRGDLLFSRANTRELVAATCLVDADFEGIFLPDKLWRISCFADVAVVEWLRFLLANEAFRGTLTKQATGTSGSMLNVSQDKLLDLEAPVPPVVDQRRFASLVWATMDERRRITRAVAAVGEMFDSLLHGAFSGEL